MILKNTEWKPSQRVAHACNPNYSGNRDQEDHSTKIAQEKEFMRLHLNQ
jgi:hypothetical protein